MDDKAFLGRGWASPVASNDARNDVALVEHEEDIRQAVLIILQTGRGERVMRPDFGAGLNEFLFEPINTTTMALVRHRVEEALITWEPRIRVMAVEVSSNQAALGQLDITIEYEVRSTNTFYNLVYPFYLQEGFT
ncbi:MAG: GPW/gp25 family protein [Rhizobacter sp.]